MFSLFKSNEGTVPVIKELPVAAATYKIGDALSIVNGLLTKATGSTKPTHISAGIGTKASNDLLAVNPIFEGYEFETTFAESGTSLKVGAKVTIHTDAAQVTAATSDGIAEIVTIEGGGASGSKVVVKF